MAVLSRRQFGALAAGAPLAGLVGASAATAGGHAGGLPALYDVSVGAYRMTAMLDGIAQLPRAAFFGEDADAIAAEMVAAAGEGETLPAPISAFLLQSDDRTILIDAGMGELDGLGPGFGRMAASLDVLGVSAADIDTVVLTHAHLDHLGGLISGAGAVYPDAELIVAEVEHGFWSDPAMRAAAPEDSRGFFDLATSVFTTYAGNLTLVGDGAEIAPGVTLMLSPGHTPGHAMVMIDGGDRQLLMVADSMHSADVHMALPETGFGFDIDPAQAAQSRGRLLDMASSDGLLIAGSHIHFPGIGRVRAMGDAYRFAPTSLG